MQKAPAQNLKSAVGTGWLTLATLFSLALFVHFHFTYTDLNIDAGWYSYPAYALSSGGDPNVNQNTLATAPDEPQLVLLFRHFTKNNVRILLMSGWFGQFEPSFVTAKVYGMLELTLALMAFAICALVLSQDRTVAACLTLLFALDAVLIDAGINDLRPDIFVAGLSLLAFFFLQRFFTAYNAVYFLAALLFCLLLALSHPTAVVSLATLLTYASIRWFNSRTLHAQHVTALVAVLWLAAVAAFFLKGSILNWLIPTDLPPRANLFGKLGQMYADAPLDVITKEARRWLSYFLWANLHLLLLFTAVLVAFLRSAVRDRSTVQLLQDYPLTLAAAAGVVALTFLDPHNASSHGLAVTPFLILAATELIKTSQRRPVRLWPIQTLVVAGCLSIVSGSMANYLQANSGAFERNADLQSRLRASFSQAGAASTQRTVVFGPAELWPYIGIETPLLMLDWRSRRSERLAEIANRIDYVVINDDYRKWDFMARMQQAAPDIGWVPVSEFLGFPGGSAQVYRKVTP